MFGAAIGTMNKILIMFLKVLILTIIVSLMIRPVTFVLKCIWKVLCGIGRKTKKAFCKK